MTLVDSDLELWERIVETADPRRVQLLNGAILVNSPLAGHQLLAMEIGFHLRSTVTAGVVVGEMLCTYELDGQPQRVIPDLLVYPANLLDVGASSLELGAVTLIVEVLSPGTAHIDVGFKWDLYAAAGVPEYWIADPETGTITAYSLVDGRWNEGQLIDITDR